MMHLSAALQAITGGLGRMAEAKGFLDYAPLVAQVVVLIGGCFAIKFSIDRFQASVSEIKSDLRDLASKVENTFEKIGREVVIIGNRVTALETVSAMLGRKPHS